MKPDDNREIDDVIYLLSRYSLGELDDTELKRLEEWKSKSEDNLLLFKKVVDEKSRTVVINEMRSYDPKPSFLRIKAQQEKIRKTRRRLWYSGVAASFVLISGISITLHLMNHSKEITIDNKVYSPKAVDASAGSNKAILTLSDGSKISLSKVSTGLLARQDGLDILAGSGRIVYHNLGNKLHSGEKLYNTITTPNGGQYTVELPDGSKVTLNAQSELTYPLDLSGDFREVSLTGEAYFEVKHDVRKPFKVSSGDQIITVLGTEFNVNSYRDEGPVRSTLINGRIQLDLTSENNKSRILKPGEQAMQVQNNFIIRPVDVDMVTAWKRGKFSFEEATVPQIMRQISRWYDVDVMYKGPIPEDTFTGGIDRQSNLSLVLQIFKESKMQFQLSNEKGRKVLTIITKNN